MDKKVKIYMLMTLASLFWAGAFIAGKMGVNQFPPFSISFFRFFFATIVIFPMMVIKEGENWKIEKENMWRIFLLGLIGMFGYHVLFFTALKFTTAINSSLIGSTNPIITGLFASLFLREKIGIKRLGAFLLALMGVVLAVIGEDVLNVSLFKGNIGDVIMFFAVLCWSVYSILSKSVLERISPIKVTAYAFLVCTILLIPFVLLERPMSYLPNITINGWAAVLYMAIFPSVIGYLIQQMAIKEIGPSSAAVFINLVPIFSIILSVLILGEKVGTIKLLGAVLVVAGVFLNTVFSRRQLRS